MTLQVGKDFILRIFFMSIIPLGNIDVMGNFSDVSIFVLSKLAPVWLFDLELRSQKFWQKFCPSLDVWSFSGNLKLLPWCDCQKNDVESVILPMSIFKITKFALYFCLIKVEIWLWWSLLMQSWCLIRKCIDFVRSWPLDLVFCACICF